jgi:hypothetical protein
MSTKIYDGKRLPDMSVLELHQFCQKLKATLLPVVKIEYIKLIATITQSAYMYMITGQNICKYSVNMKELGEPNSEFSSHEIFFFAKEQADKLITNTSNATRRIDSESDADFDVSLCVFPLHDKILCIPYANHETLREVLFSADEFSDYGYWNNTDPPTDMSNDEWRQRKIDWYEALPGPGIPRENGMVFQIIDAPYDVLQRLYVTLDDIIPYFISNEELCKEYAKNSIFEHEFQRCVKELGGDWIRNGYRCLRQAQEYVKSHEDEVQRIDDSLKSTVKCMEFFQEDSQL